MVQVKKFLLQDLIGCNNVLNGRLSKEVSSLRFPELARPLFRRLHQDLGLVPSALPCAAWKASDPLPSWGSPMCSVKFYDHL
jgi:hypothetical protein